MISVFNMKNHYHLSWNILLRSISTKIMEHWHCECMFSFSYQVDKILKVIPRERRTFLFSATMTKKVDSIPVLFCVTGRRFARKTKSITPHSFLWFTGPETPESSSERSCQVCGIHQILYSRQTAAILHLHTIKVQGRVHRNTHFSFHILMSEYYNDSVMVFI